jgi:cytochrome c-type biogenesis protein CcmH/NrfG
MRTQTFFNRTFTPIQINQCILCVLLFFSGTQILLAQRGVPASRASGFTVFGDLDVSGEGLNENKPMTFDLLLYSRSGVLLDRQKVGSKGRYRFLNVPPGDFQLVIEFENSEVARTQLRLVGPATDVRQDLTLQWHENTAPKARAATISAEDAYNRRPPNKARFEKAQEAFDKKEYDKAVALFTHVVGDDPQDFQAWSELGTVYLVQKNLVDAEKSYQRATEVRGTFFRALLNLGRVRLLLKDFNGAITVLSQAVTVRPTSAEANYFLGNAYLEIKKGSQAVGYLYEALRLDPTGMAEAHLRLAALYNGAGLKEKAAAEYEAFLKKKPDYPDRRKLEQYIAANKK